jgi:hypothetical protein
MRETYKENPTATSLKSKKCAIPSGAWAFLIKPKMMTTLVHTPITPVG